MPVATNWTVNNMRHNDSDGGVFLVYWSCTAENDSGPETATAGGKYSCTSDPSAPSFIPYDNLTENDVLGWGWADGLDGETKEEVQTRLVEKVDAQIARNSTTSDGVPWS